MLFILLQEVLQVKDYLQIQKILVFFNQKVS